MTSQEAKAILEANAVPAFPQQIDCLDWLTAMDMASEALEKQEKYKWHDLRKNPDDLPEKQPKLTMSKPVIVWMGDSYWNHLMQDYYDYSNHEWALSSLYEIHDWSLIQSNEVIAWKYIEPFGSEEN